MRSRSTQSPLAHFLCEADVLDGLAPLAEEELRRRLGGRVRMYESRGDALHFELAGDLRVLFLLRSITAAYLVLRFNIPRPKALLGHEHFERIAHAVGMITLLSPHGAFRTLRLSAAGEDSAVLARLKDALAQRLGLTVVTDEGDLLLRLRRSGDRSGWELLIRVTPRPLSTRAWRVCNFPGAPNATLAHAVMRLSQPSHEDTLLNICCGSGTLLVERLALGPARAIIGCDVSAKALACARQNLRAAGVEQDVRLEEWDAAHVPLPDASVTTICADLPYGQLVGSHRENETLYPRIIAEAARIAQPGARMVLLTHELRLLERAATIYHEAWEHVETVRVRSGGMTPGVFVFQRRHNP